MLVKKIIDEDYNDYRKPSMFIATPCCTFKCDVECGKEVCQNSDLVKQETILVDNKEIINRYLENNLTESIVFGGLEPFDIFNDILEFIHMFRKKSKDDIVIYTGYKEEEIYCYTDTLRNFKNIIIKFGRFIPNKRNIMTNYWE
jgi:hypothetical protein